MTLYAWFHTHPFALKLVYGAVTGFGSAAAIDVLAFLKWRSWHDGVVFDWGVATLRWMQGAVSGVVTAAGLSLGGAVIQ